MHEAEQTAHQTPDEEHVLCTVCLHSNNSRANYCFRCGAPINTLLGFAPYDQILLEGFAYRRAVDGPPSKVILLGIWFRFGPALLLSLFVLSSVYQNDRVLGRLVWFAHLLFWLAYFFVSAAILYRTTVNFLSKRRIEKPANA